MALLTHFYPLHSLVSFICSSSSSASAIAATPFSGAMLVPKPYCVQSNYRIGHCDNKKRSLTIVKASSKIPDDGKSESESDDADVLIEDELALDPKLQLRLEKKMKMKFQKKIRLRRKKLVRKRRMRKRGCWPPSKLKKKSQN